MGTLKYGVLTLRPHHWLKNLLLFVPTLAAHDFRIGSFVAPFVAFLSFCSCSSAGYMLNDLIDLKHDQAHPYKRNRPLAAGRITRNEAAVVGLAVLALAIAFAILLPPLFLGFLAAYLGITLTYSTWIKRVMIVDVVVLACLYGIRVLAGGVALNRPVSSWLIAFSLFLFFNLALIKRCSELVDIARRGTSIVMGRGYALSDLPVLQSLAAASGLVAVLVFALYVDSSAVTTLYRHPTRLWLICVVLIAWISRMLLLTARGEMHHDPIVFAARDRFSLAALAITTVIAALSI